jgi:PAS domain S-box-containing protein
LELKRADSTRLEQLARVFDASPDYVAISRVRDGLVLAVNAAFERVMGYRTDDIVGRTVGELRLWAIPGERERSLADLEEAGGVLHGRRVLLRTRSGGTITGTLSSSLFEHDGERLLVSVVHDISETKRLERRASDSERKFGLVFATIPDPIVITRETDGVYLQVNAAWLRLTGHSRERAIGRSSVELGLWADPAARAQMMQQLSSEGMVNNYSARLKRAGGETFPALISAARIAIDGENCILSTWRDIGELIAAQDRAREASAGYRTLFDSALDGIMIVGPNHTLVEANPAACEMTGYAHDEMVGMHASRLFPADELRARPLRDLAQKWSHMERVIVRKDGGTLPVEILGGPMPDGKGVAIWRDITERKRAEALMRQTNESLERLVRERTSELEAANRDLESYNYSVSHDLRQPLNAIVGFADLLQEALGAPAGGAGPAQEYVAEIEASAARMENMIESLMQLAGAARRAIHKVDVNLDELVNSVLHDLSSAAPIAAEVVVGALPAVRGDPVLLRQVWANLIGNALKYSSGTPSPRVEVSAGRRDGAVECMVRDNGVGFDMQHAARLFGAFQRLPSAAGFQGSGVGLAIVERIVRRHGGTISAESTPGRGAVFRFTLPDKDLA